MSKNNHVLRGMLCAALAGIFWGFSAACGQLLAGNLGISVLWITAIRIIGAAIILSAVCLIRYQKDLLTILSDKSSLLRILAIGLFSIVVSQIAYLMAVSHTNAGTGALFKSLSLVIVVVFVCCSTKRLPKINEIIGFILAVVGTTLIATQGSIDSLAIPTEALLWGGIAAIAVASYTLIPNKKLKEQNSLVVTGMAMFVAGIASIITMKPWTIPVEVNFEITVVLGLMILLGTVGSYVLLSQGIADAGAVRVGLVGCIEPVAATIISALWLGTNVSSADFSGGFMIVLMMILLVDRNISTKTES